MKALSSSIAKSEDTKVDFLATQNWPKKMRRVWYIRLRSRYGAENFIEKAPICKQCATQRILKSAKKWVSYGLFTCFLKHLILQVNRGIIFQGGTTKLLLNLRKRLLWLLLKGHLDISIRSRVITHFWQNFEKLPKTAIFGHFLAVFWPWTKK